MKLSAKLKKRFLWGIFLPALSLLIGGGIFYYLLVYRFKDGVKFIINKESKGRYVFDASHAGISLRHGVLRLNNAVLYNVDTADADINFKVQIPEIYFSLFSWKELLLHKKIIVDSLSLIHPFIDVSVRKLPARKDHPEFHASDILTYLEKALARFNVHSFSLKDAAFSYKQFNAFAPLAGDHINLSVSNFTVINNEDNHILGSDNVSILLGRQHWVLPDNKNEIGFGQLKFDSKGQRFELDSFSFYQKTDSGLPAISLQADKFFFNSRHLPAIYQKEQLLLDTLLCVNPILSIPASTQQKDSKDSAARQIRNSLFSFINVRFISIIDGQLQLQNKDGRIGNATTRKANVDIFNLSVHPTTDTPLNTDSIRISLKNIEFLTRDSLYKLTIDEFTFRQRDASFGRVRFGPVIPRTSDKRVEFTAPSLLLKDIDIAELIQHHLKASRAELNHPLIIMHDRPGDTTRRSHLSSSQKLALFYQTLHSVRELINTPDFDLKDGIVSYRLSGITPVEATIENLDAHILLNKLFVSDSLIDIKNAIPSLRIGNIHLSSKGLTASLDRFSFNGIQQTNQIGKVNISTTAGLEFTGENIFWKVFDWGVYQKNKTIQIDSLQADQLTIHTAPRPTPVTVTPAILPVIRIGQLDINEIVFDHQLANTPFHTRINSLHAGHLTSIKQFFTWDHLSLKLPYTKFENEKTRVAVDNAGFDSDSGLLINNLQYRSGNGRTAIGLSIPFIHVKAGIHSSDFSQLTLSSLITSRTTITCNNTRDTLQNTAVATAKNIRISTGKDLAIRYEELALHNTKTRLKKDLLLLDLPESSLRLSNGHINAARGKTPSLSTNLIFVWKDAGLKYASANTTLSVNGLSGSVKKETFLWSPTHKNTWRQLVADMTVSKGSAHYKGNKITAELGGLSWEPHNKTLRLRNFSVTPNESRESLFNKAVWQGDFIAIKGDALTLAGIIVNLSPNDSAISASRLFLDGVSIDASRDKQVPFRHGLEKLMPTKLIRSIPLSLHIDTISIRNSHVTYNERSASTGLWSSIPIEEINGTLLHVGSRNNRQDTLMLSATGRLFDGRIRHFAYQELYGDSLSAFSARTYLSALDLTRFSQVSIPAAAVSITGGHTDTAWSTWQGNKYVSFGSMNFYYDRLKIKVLNNNKKGWLVPALKTWVANLLLPDQRKKTSLIFVERDREKFVFNYWVKAQTSGILSTVGLKSSSSYRKHYRRLLKTSPNYFISPAPAPPVNSHFPPH